MGAIAHIHIYTRKKKKKKRERKEKKIQRTSDSGGGSIKKKKEKEKKNSSRNILAYWQRRRLPPSRYIHVLLQYVCYVAYIGRVVASALYYQEVKFNDLEREYFMLNIVSTSTSYYS